MTSDELTGPVEPDTALVREFHVRRDDDYPSTLVDDIMALLEPEGAVVDLSRYDRRADVVQLRTAHPSGRKSET